MNIVVTGSRGFIGRNLCLAIQQSFPEAKLVPLLHDDTKDNMKSIINQADIVFHAAGVNRPSNISEFKSGNTDFTDQLLEFINPDPVKKITFVYLSSIQAKIDNDYGKSKQATEKLLNDSRSKINPIIYQLPNVFGKWCRPFYNSVVATFCQQVVTKQELTINDPHKELELIYIDDLVHHLLMHINSQSFTAYKLSPIYKISVGELAQKLQWFYSQRTQSLVAEVGTGLNRALYATLMSYLTPEQFTYQMPQFTDPRGNFVEILKTQNSGQFSFFTSHPGVTRGGHYHHTKIEKFMVIQGQALFRFRHLITNEYFEYQVDGQKSEIVQTIPGWTHDVINNGATELLCFIWANEIFDRQNPDTYGAQVKL